MPCPADWNKINWSYLSLFEMLVWLQGITIPFRLRMPRHYYTIQPHWYTDTINTLKCLLIGPNFIGSLNQKVNCCTKNVLNVKSSPEVKLSLILYFCSCFCDCRQCLLNWEVQTWQMAPCHNRWDSAVLLKLVSLRFMHSTLRYSPKRKGHPKAFLPLILNHCCDVFKIML